MELRDIVHEYWEARKTAFTERTILASWRKSGICPLNPSIFTDADFAPSIISSTKNQLPASFPRRLPRAPNASSDDMFDPAELERMEAERDANGSLSESDDGSDSSDDGTFMLSDSNSCDDHMLQASTLPRATSSSPPPSISMPTPLSTHHTRQTTSLTQQTPMPTTHRPSHKRTQNGSAQSRDFDQDCQIIELQKQLAISEAERDAARAHAVIAGVEAGMWKHKFNNKSQKKDSSKRFHMDTCILTSMEGKELAAAETERKSKTKPHLIDLAVALGLKYKGASIDVLCVRINAHFNANLELKSNPRYVALFTRKRKRTGDENDDPRASRRRRSLTPGPSSRRSLTPGPSSHHSPTPGPSSRRLSPTPASLYHSYHPSIPPTSHCGFGFENRKPSTAIIII
ncbi:hypothetical protein BDP27DRAFT_1422803 [Rhodocollybia butyracea]|uniref:Uncharacterized protein n=1 Tax=Rhodocollybia butyracea TaxID=206335 RepID=A0A9P5PQF9_9AGAR|nr:hypothetical protein BDP27DRAFT_1422803 [Rhodocollybia butyracea]